MPGIQNERNFSQKIIDRIVSNLTGEPLSHKKHHSLPAGDGIVARPLPPRPKKLHAGHHPEKYGLSRLLHRIFNSRSNHRKRSPAVSAVKSPAVVYTGNMATEQSFDSKNSSGATVIKTGAFDARKKTPKKKKSFLRTLFKTSKTTTENKVFSTKKSRTEFFNALPAEGFAFLNSAGLYILAYLVIYLAYQLTGALAASNYGIDSVLFYYELYFPIGNSSPLWTRLNIIIITLASPFSAVMISIVLFRVVLIREKLNPQVRLFLLWVAFHGATHFLGAFVAGIVTNQGFGYVANWLYINVFIRILVSLIFLFLLTLSGYFSVVFALETIPPGIRQQRWRLSLALGSRLIFPWIIGGLLIMFVKYPNAMPQHENIMIYDAVIIASMGFMVIPAFFNFKAKPRALAERPQRNKRPPGILIFMLALVTLIGFRLFLERGLHFIIQFSFDVGFYR